MPIVVSIIFMFFVTRVAISSRFRYRLRIIKISLALAHQKYILMTFRRPVGHALRHRIGLVPDDIATQIPAVGLQREGETPRDANQIFSLQSILPVPIAAVHLAA